MGDGGAPTTRATFREIFSNKQVFTKTCNEMLVAFSRFLDIFLEDSLFRKTVYVAFMENGFLSCCTADSTTEKSIFHKDYSVLPSTRI